MFYASDLLARKLAVKLVTQFRGRFRGDYMSRVVLVRTVRRWDSFANTAVLFRNTGKDDAAIKWERGKLTYSRGISFLHSRDNSLAGTKFLHALAFYRVASAQRVEKSQTHAFNFYKVKTPEMIRRC